eukprot:886430-Rhodomonas_salina.1
MHEAALGLGLQCPDGIASIPHLRQKRDARGLSPMWAAAPGAVTERAAVKRHVFSNCNSGQRVEKAFVKRHVFSNCIAGQRVEKAFVKRHVFFNWNSGQRARIAVGYCFALPELMELSSFRASPHLKSRIEMRCHAAGKCLALQLHFECTLSNAALRVRHLRKPALVNPEINRRRHFRGHLKVDENCVGRIFSRPSGPPGRGTPPRRRGASFCQLTYELLVGPKGRSAVRRPDSA